MRIDENKTLSNKITLNVDIFDLVRSDPFEWIVFVNKKDVLNSIDIFQTTIFGKFSNISGMKPTIFIEFLLIGCMIFVVARENVRSFHTDLEEE